MHDLILEDLRAGLRRRAARRRARTAATGSVTLVLMAAGLVGGAWLDRSAPAIASTGGPDAASLLLHGCEPLNLPKSAHEHPQDCVVP
jgi:hypothetical protein